MIAISEVESQLLKSIIIKHVPRCKVIAFGSRIDGTYTPASDLDIAIISDPPKRMPVWEIKEELMESDIPFKVDVLDYQNISDNFRNVINRKYQILFDTTGE